MRLIGKNIGHYKIVDLLGAGGMATVYRAQQTNMEREVAFKVMAAAFAQQPEFVERFKREADLFAKLEHPHILPIYDYGDRDGYLFLVLRLMEGGNLEAQVRHRTMNLAHIGKIIGQIASALDYAHSHGVIHRDMKPNNVLLDPHGNAYLMDFGIAKILAGSRLTATGTLLGTPAYMAPEMWKLDEIDGRSDLYSLGLMLYEILTGELPYTGDTPFQFMYAHLHEPVPAISKFGLPKELDDVIWRSTAKNPKDRYDNVTQFAEALVDAIHRADAQQQMTGQKASRASEQLGKILVALERSESGLYAVPKLDDFVKQAYLRPTQVSKHTGIDNLIDAIEHKPSTQTFKTEHLQGLLSQGKVSEAFLGVSAQPVNLPKAFQAHLGQLSGLLIMDVESESPAEDAGLFIGDILVRIADHLITNQDDLKAAMRDEYVDQAVPLEVIRAGQLQQVEIVLGRK